MLNLSRLHVVAALAFTLTSASALAGQVVVEKNPVEKEPVVVESPFAKGRMELQIGVGGYHSFGDASDARPEVVDLGGVVRLGWMLTDVHGDGCFRGNWEFLTEFSGGGIVEGPGDVLLNLTLLLRYNFVKPDSKCVPYFQLGGGGTYSDAHEDPVQRVLGSEFLFNLQAGFGIRYMCSDRCAVFIEANYRHISNADTSDRNYGLNSIGGWIGVSTFF